MARLGFVLAGGGGRTLRCVGRNPALCTHETWCGGRTRHASCSWLGNGGGGAATRGASVRASVVMRSEREVSSALKSAWRLSAASASLPHPDKASSGGEDALFVTDNAAGVFDGVGGWARQGVDPGIYSRRLAELTKQNLMEDASADLTRALDRAHVSNKETGSTTACIARLDAPGVVSVLNVGDSGLLAVRPGAGARHERKGGIFFRTEAQQHSFNCPLQLGSTFEDKAADGRLHEFAVEAGDYLVLATDGVLDNLYEDDVEFVVRRLFEQHGDDLEPQLVADVLARRARVLAEDESYMSPFSMNAAQMGYRAIGGKLDDITVVVARARRSAVAS